MFKRIQATIKDQIMQGASARGLALSLAAAATLALFPLMGFTTLLCFGAGVLFRLNHPLMQAVNYLLFPVQLIMIPVFLRIGEWMWRVPPVSISPLSMAGEFSQGPGQFVVKYGQAGGLAVFAWILTAPLVGLAAYVLIKPTFEKISKQLLGARS